MRYIIFDLEATCMENNREFKNEIIEIGAVKLDNNIEIDTFDCFVKPTINPILSDFCKSLTSINQNDVDNADILNIVLPKFVEWANEGTTDKVVFCSWGFYDRHQIEKQCEWIGNLDSSFIQSHVSLKHLFHTVHKKDTIPTRGIGMEKALRLMHIPLDGTHHRGIDDAKNIAKIFIHYYDLWKIEDIK